MMLYLIITISNSLDTKLCEYFYVTNSCVSLNNLTQNSCLRLFADEDFRPKIQSFEAGTNKETVH